MVSRAGLAGSFSKQIWISSRSALAVFDRDAAFAGLSNGHLARGLQCRRRLPLGPQRASRDHESGWVHCHSEPSTAFLIDFRACHGDRTPGKRGDHKRYSV
jgi:hypothetical protein